MRDAKDLLHYDFYGMKAQLQFFFSLKLKLEIVIVPHMVLRIFLRVKKENNSPEYLMKTNGISHHGIATDAWEYITAYKSILNALKKRLRKW